MLPRLLLDTHVIVRWLMESKRLSREQARVLEAATRRGETLAISAVTLIEIAMLTSEGRLRIAPDVIFEKLRESIVFRILPITFEIASEVASLGRALGDPADRAIVATARVHRLRLVTSDQRIIESNLVPVID